MSCVNELMEKYKHLTANYILTQLYSQNLLFFSSKLFAEFFGINTKKAYQIIFSLKKRELIKEVERDRYLVLGYEPHRVLSNPFFIVCQIVQPSYISFRSALHHYGFTEQVPFTIYAVATKRKRTLFFENFAYRYTTFSRHKFFGYERQTIGELPVLMAEKEKSLIDSLDQLQLAGGLEEVAKALFNAKDEIDGQRLIDYALRMRNKSLCSRLGFLLEKYQMEWGGLEKSLSASTVLLDPRQPRSKIWNKKWQINVNVSDDELFAWQKS